MAITGGLVVGGLLYKQHSDSKKQAKASSKIAEDSRRKQEELTNQLNKKTSTEDADRAQVQQQARMRQKARAAGATGRKSTILTGQLGIQGGDSGVKKTLGN